MNVYLEVTWPEVVFTDTGEEDGLEFEQVIRGGHVLNTSFCPVTQKWNILVIGHDGKFHNLQHDQDELYHEWVAEVEEAQDGDE